MHSIRQLLRQPIKALAGLILIILAVAILCVSLGQSLAAGRIEQQLEDNYITAAIPTDKYQKGSGSSTFVREFPADVLDWILTTAAENPDVVELVDSRGLASAYIPELSPLNPVTEFTTASLADPRNENYDYVVNPFNAPYSQGMFAITLTEIGEAEETADGVTVPLTGVIDEVLALGEGYADPTGFTAKLTLNLSHMVHLNELDLTVGEQYLVYGRNYKDLDWLIRCDLYRYTLNEYDVGTTLDYIDLDNIYHYNEESIAAYQSMARWDGSYYVAHLIFDRMGPAGMVTQTYQLTNYQLEDIHTITMTLESETAPYPELTTILHVEGSVEQTLGKNTLWRKTWENISVNARSFPVIGTQQLLSVAAFAQENARIVEGRSFTEEEYASGAAVCVISTELAEANGLTVGDTLTLNYYNFSGTSPYQKLVSEGYGILNPSAYYFDSTTYFSGSPVVCTIVGLYDQDATSWSREDFYCFTDNTIFVPTASVTGKMDYANQGLFLSLVIRNGQLDAFRQIVAEANHSGLFEYYDQGYEVIHDSLHDYSQVADRAMSVGLAVYTVVLLLYLILFPGFQRKNLAAMASMGASRREKLLHMMVSSAGILVPGTAFGILLSVLSWENVVDRLADSAGSTLELALNIPDLLLLGLAQLILALALSFGIALLMTARENLMERAQGSRSRRRGRFNSWTVAVFAVVVALVLCALQAGNEAERRSYEESRATAPIKVSVISYTSGESDNLYIRDTVIKIFTSDQFKFMTIADLITDVQLKSSYTPSAINGSSGACQVVGITSTGIAKELTDEYSAKITWLNGYGEEVLTSGEAVCIVPEGYTDDADPNTDGQQLVIDFPNEFYSFITYTETFTVVGTYTTKAVNGSIYCPYGVIERVNARLEQGVTADALTATLADNSRLDELKQRADRLFVPVGTTENPPANKVHYALDINDDALVQLEATLERSIQVNQACTILIFVLSAGAGFFLGFLMIRQRKREILLMRTLGKPNNLIFRDFAVEQMKLLVLGAVLGGAVFRWNAAGNLCLFALIFALGLSGALALFLRTTLLTGIKEED